MDVLTDKSAIIDLQAKLISFSADRAVTLRPSAEQRTSLRIADDHVRLPPRAILMIVVYSQDDAPDTEAIVKSDQGLLLERGVSVAKGIVRLKQGNTHVLITNSTEEYQHINKGSSIAFLEYIQEECDVIAVAVFQRVSYATF